MSGRIRSTSVARFIGPLARAHHTLHVFIRRTFLETSLLRVWYVVGFLAAAVCSSIVRWVVGGLGLDPNASGWVSWAVMGASLAGLSVWPVIDPGTFKRNWVLGVLATGAFLGLAVRVLLLSI
ncbi:hypothetical protein ABTX81_39330 [Kitasatospora sp. NPDC097605]|uniref:hypothetical protein n=1 Tax=Kitasatospora sp. NPDC097605 TaxID=3157226 RepID=UPI0033238B25